MDEFSKSTNYTKRENRKGKMLEVNRMKMSFFSFQGSLTSKIFPITKRLAAFTEHTFGNQRFDRSQPLRKAFSESKQFIASFSKLLFSKIYFTFKNLKYRMTSEVNRCELNNSFHSTVLTIHTHSKLEIKTFDIILSYKCEETVTLISKYEIVVQAFIDAIV